MQKLGIRTKSRSELAAQRFDVAAGGLPGKGQNFQRDLPSGPQTIDELGVVGDHGESLGCFFHDLLAEMGRSAAFDQVQLGVDFIGAIDGEIQFSKVVEIEDLDAQGAGEIRGIAGSGAALDPKTRHVDAFGQKLHQMPGGGSGSQPQGHAVFHEFQGCRRRGPFGGFEGFHDCAGKVQE